MGRIRRFLCCSTNCKLSTATIVGLVLSLLGLIFSVYWASIFDRIVDEQLALTSNTSKSYDMWKVTPIPMYLKFNFFNWTNPPGLKDPNGTEEFQKPILKEVGPYVFKEHREKVVKAWFPANHTIMYYQNRTWIFEPELSVGNLSDLITTVNVPAVTAVYSLKGLNAIEKFFVDMYLTVTLKTRISVTKTAGEFLFDGYDDPILDAAAWFAKHVKIPVNIPFDKFGWFYARNGNITYDGIFNMHTGVGDMSKFGELQTWNYQNTTNDYPSPCGVVSGSAGDFFPPRLTRHTPLSIFITDICRPLPLHYKEDVRVRNIKALRYWANETMFDNKTTVPENWCFCPPGSISDQDCPPRGAMDISSCKWGAPAFISFPHFLHGDPSYSQAVVGMKPNASLHQMYMDFEPNSGLTLQVSAAMQLNILVQPMKEFSILKNIPYKFYFPAIWFQQTALVDEAMASQIRLLSEATTIGSVVFLAILGIGATVLLVTAICWINIRCRRDDSDDERRVILVNSDEDGDDDS